MGVHNKYGANYRPISHAMTQSEIILSEIAREAEKLGMSYGEYVVYLDEQKEHKKNTCCNSKRKDEVS